MVIVQMVAEYVLKREKALATMLRHCQYARAATLNAFCGY